MMNRWVNDDGIYRTRRAVAATCPGCKTALNMATAAEVDRRPADGDVSVCSYCGTVAEWTDGMTRLVAVDETALNAEDRQRLADVRAMIAVKGDAR